MTTSNLLITGDSFCEHRHRGSWPFYLQQYYNIHLKGFGGQSWWHSRRWLLKNMPSDQSNTVLIFFHTSPFRLPAIKNVAITPWIMRVKSESGRQSELSESDDPDGSLAEAAVKFYSSELFVQEFYIWAQESFIQQLAAESANFKKVIHFTSVGGLSQDAIKSLVTSNSVVCTSVLKEWSMAETGETLFGGPDKRLNHFNQHNNIAFSKYVHQLIEHQATGTQVQINNIADWDLSKPELIVN